MTLFLSVAPMPLGLVFGLALALAKIYRAPALRQLAAVYVSFIRGTPAVVQLFLVYYGYGLPWGIRSVGGAVNPDFAPDLNHIDPLWFALAGRARGIEVELAATFFGGDALPVAQTDFGPGIVPGLLGHPYILDAESIWFDTRPYEDPAALAGLSPQRDTEFYRAYLGLTRRLLEQAQGRYIVASADFGSAFDLLAALYRRENLLADIADDPERVKALLDLALGWWSEAVRENHALIRRYQQYFSTWAPLVNSKSFFTQGSEISVMISGRAFAELSLPVLNREAAIHGQSLFTLDGDSFVRHLPAIYRIGGLHAVNWGPTRKYTGPDSSYKDYTDPWALEVCRAIQERTKLVLLDLPVWQVDGVMRHISHDGVFLQVDCATETEAEDFCAYARRWMR